MTYTVAVRALCEFTAKRGDLDLRFTPSPSSQEGIAGHQLVASRRKNGYQSEVTLQLAHGGLLVRGRADGYDPQAGRLEEVKTYRGRLESMPANHRHLHWAQAKVYGHMLCEKLGLPALEIALVYLDVASKRETVLAQQHDADSLRRHFQALCRRFEDWAEQEVAHRRRRDQALRDLGFPHPAFREGQRPLAEAVYRALRDGRCLAVQAPTGIGKTMGTLFPALKAMPGQALDKLFFLTAKTSGRGVALDALAGVRAHAGGMPLRIIELTARDKACEHPGTACHGEACPLAKGFYDRLGAARAQALQSSCLDRDALREAALRHQVCPYYLGQEMVRWCDVVVGDYNYYFDAGAMLYGQTLAQPWRAAVLVDEAHNLVERGRAMYTAALNQAALRALRRGLEAQAGAAAPGRELKKALDGLHRQWNAVSAGQEHAYQPQPRLPDRFILALQRAAGAILDHLAQDPAQAPAALQRFYFDAVQFLQLADSFDAHSLFDVTLTQHGKAARRSAVLCLRNVVPAPFLAPRFAGAHACVLFSATLHPWRFYADTLGLPGQTGWLDIAPPFRAEQLSVRVAAGISSRYAHREASLAPMAELIACQYRERPGNYLVFLSSFDYLARLLQVFRQASPDIPAWEQARAMDEAEREAFLARFVESGRGIGFAVLGGAFAEGVDLPGKRLIGAFIATLGLPQVNEVNEQIRLRLQDSFGQGYEYAYLYPGLRKVVQAAGRVIRGPSDEGVLVLMDDRYGRPAVRRLLPAWWRVSPLRMDAACPRPASAAVLLPFSVNRP